jgi:hypothetical protein
LTDDDLVGALSVLYGSPVPVETKAPRNTAVSSGNSIDMAVARWESSEASVTLLRGNYSPDLSLVLLSKRLSVLATSAAKEAIRLDAVEAPQPQKVQRAKEAADGQAALDRARAANKVTFRP